MAVTVSTFNATRPFHSAVIMASTAQELSTSVNVTWATVQSEFVEVKIATTVERIVIPLVVIIGVVGNFLSFFTLTFSSLRQTSTCVYMAVVALLDNVILILDLCVLVRFYLGHTEFYFRNDWACGFHFFLFYFSIHFVTLTLLAMTVDRYLVVKFPLKAQIWSTPKSAISVMLGIGLFSFALNFQILFTRGLAPSGNPADPFKCWYLKSEVDFFMQKIYTWIDASIYSFIPFISLLVLNVLIIRQLEKSRSFGRQFAESSASRNGNSSGIHRGVTTEGSCVPSNSSTGPFQTLSESTDHNFINESAQNPLSQGRAPIGAKLKKPSSGANSNNITVMLLMVSFTFLWLTSPVVIVLLYKRYYWLPTTDHELAKARLVHAFVDNLMYTNHASNFFLYCLSGSRFRLELRCFSTKVWIYSQSFLRFCKTELN